MKLDKPAKVGNTVFRAGVSADLVIGAAQRLYEYENAPSKEQERLKAGVASVNALQVALESPAVAAVLAERRRQVEVEGWTPEHDDEHVGGQLAMAAACYAAHSAVDECINCTDEDPGPALTMLLARAQDFVAKCWPWSPRWWKPRDKRRNLVKAGALILAEIERYDRKTTAA